MTEHPAIEALRRCRMDLTAAQARITDALNELKASSFKTPPPSHFDQLRREVANGAICDEVDLLAAVRALELSSGQIDDLRASLPLSGAVAK